MLKSNNFSCKSNSELKITENLRILSCRFHQRLQDEEFKDITPELKRQAYDWIHRMQNSYEGSESWFETSCSSLPEYQVCDGNQLNNWKDKGYVTVFDLLQVSFTDEHFRIQFKQTQSFIEIFCVVITFRIKYQQIRAIKMSSMSCHIFI